MSDDMTQILVETLDISSKIRKKLSKINYSIIQESGIAEEITNYSTFDTYLIVTNNETQISTCLNESRTLPSEFWLQMYKRMYDRSYTANKDLVEFLNLQPVQTQENYRVKKLYRVHQHLNRLALKHKL